MKIGDDIDGSDHPREKRTNGARMTTTATSAWWSSYNKVKHQRDAHFTLATLHNALNAMGGLDLVARRPEVWSRSFLIYNVRAACTSRNRSRAKAL
jgi:hypothetical protein